MLVEADYICNGITRNTTAKITSQHGLIYDSIIRRFGLYAAKKYFYTNENAISQFKKIARYISCHLREADSYIFSLGKATEMCAEKQAMERIGADAHYCKNLPLPFSVTGAICLKNQEQFKPMSFLASILNNLNINIYENTRVTEITPEVALYELGSIKASKIIVATHYPFANKHGCLFIKQYQHRSYVIAFENAPQLNGMFIDSCSSGLSFRNYKELLLIGGGVGRTGTRMGGWNDIISFANNFFPLEKAKYRFATQDCMTLGGFPYIGN